MAATARSVRGFTCSKKSFYSAPGGGTRKIHVPNWICDSMWPADDVLEALCCANTHVVCSDQYSTPTLLSYDGGRYKLDSWPQSNFLQQGLDTLCAMSMAKSCSDCDRSRCATQWPAAAPATPYYPFPRGNSHTTGNIWSFTVG